MKETFGQRFTRLRKELGMTQQDIADKVGITFQSVSKWEQDINLPDVNMLTKLSDILNVTIDELLGKKKEVEVSTKDIKDLILKIKVIGDVKVTVNFPVSVIKVLLETTGTIPGVDIKSKNINFDEIFNMIENGVVGNLVEIDTDDEKVIICVE